MSDDVNKMIKEVDDFLSDKRVMINSHFKYGNLKRHLIIESGSKFSNKLKVKNGQDELNKISNLVETFNELKYKIVEHGTYALCKDLKHGHLYTGEVVRFEKYAGNKLYYARIKIREIKCKEGQFLIEEEYKLDPKDKKGASRYLKKTIATNLSTESEVDITKINKYLGREFYLKEEPIPSGHIPIEIFFNSYDGKSEIEGLDEIFNLERQLLKEIVRDLNLSRKKVLYKTRLARKEGPELEVEMNTKSLVVFEDGNAVFTSPIDLWSPALNIEAITRCIDWLVNYTLKMKFAAKDTLSTGAQKTDEQISEINQAAQNYTEDKKELWTISLNNFLQKNYSKNIDVEIQLMTTINRLVNGGTNKPTEGDE